MELDLRSSVQVLNKGIDENSGHSVAYPPKGHGYKGSQSSDG